VRTAAFPIVESSAQHIFGWSDIATVALRSDHESLDGAGVHVVASTELKRCVRNRGGTPNLQAWPASHLPRRARGSRAVTWPKLCCAGKPRPPATAPTFGRGQHSSARNIGRHMLRATYGDVPLCGTHPRRFGRPSQRRLDSGALSTGAGARTGRGITLIRRGRCVSIMNRGHDRALPSSSSRG
jgi:hypothetical protein